MRSTYLAAWQSGKCFRVPVQSLTCWWSLPGTMCLIPLNVHFSTLSWRALVRKCVWNPRGLSGTQEVEMHYFCFGLLHLTLCPLLIFVLIRDLGLFSRGLRFCELWFWDPIYPSSCSLWLFGCMRWVHITGFLGKSHFKIFCLFVP